ncbi:site-specific integrase [Cellulomonas fimi]|uniref:site-specific integrase n=1 Tax=Cellulomonas fimi TaxID=1708 RepID=UPI000674E2F6|nr:site-specific integrase [Cellulomonas fimi]NNH09227.1 site-specific integrase [Cellulomonas fimi]
MSDPEIRTTGCASCRTSLLKALREAIALELDGGPDDLVFPTTRATPRAPSHVRDHLKQALEGVDLDVTPHDFRRTVATQVARATTLANATALLGHADEMTTDQRGSGPPHGHRPAGVTGVGGRIGE